MKTFRFIIFLLFILHAFSATAATDPCSSLSDLESKTNQAVFVGFGTGTSQAEADQNAQVALARTIRQKIIATSMVTETNADSQLQSDSKSVVSESILGAKVLRRCEDKEHFSTVVTLSKNIFITSLEEKLKTNYGKVNAYIKAIDSPTSDEAQANAIESAKKFLHNYEQTLESDLELCKVYNGCSKINDNGAFAKLADLINKNGDKDQYILLSNNNTITADFRDELVSLLEEENFKIMDTAVADTNDIDSAKRKIFAKCQSHLGSKIPSTDDRVVSVTCQLEGYIGKQKKFSRRYSCQATADSSISEQDAVNTCHMRLKKE